MSRVTLHIDRLVLRGIDPLDSPALIDGLRTELTQLLDDAATREAMRKSRVTPLLRLGKVPMQPGLAGARALGSNVARAMAKGMKP